MVARSARSWSPKVTASPPAAAISRTLPRGSCMLTARALRSCRTLAPQRCSTNWPCPGPWLGTTSSPRAGSWVSWVTDLEPRPPAREHQAVDSSELPCDTCFEKSGPVQSRASWAADSASGPPASKSGAVGSSALSSREICLERSGVAPARASAVLKSGPVPAGASVPSGESGASFRPARNAWAATSGSSACGRSAASSRAPSAGVSPPASSSKPYLASMIRSLTTTSCSSPASETALSRDSIGVRVLKCTIVLH
mmetsp:Transcript_101164/g.315279  ORF Transcript_101164/g.315279 Transcript_101164/m.315279 type:complete len:255 (-) Transcript_101164:7-771(-)